MLTSLSTPHRADRNWHPIGLKGVTLAVSAAILRLIIVVFLLWFHCVASHVQVGVGDMTQILYHDNNIYHDIVIFFILKIFFILFFIILKSLIP